MALPTTPASSWLSGTDLPNQLFEWGSDDYDLYEDDDEFVLSVEMPGYEPDEIDVSWNDGMLNVAAERQEDAKGRRRTYHRRFRFPKTIDDEQITAQYTNGILEVRLPIEAGATVHGREIEVQS